MALQEEADRGFRDGAVKRKTRGPDNGPASTLQPMEWIEEDLKELAPILEMINHYLPQMEYIYAATRVTDIRSNTVEQLKSLKEMGLREI